MRFKVKSIHSDPTGRNCEHCGRYITHYAKLIDFDKKIYIRVGLECATTLTDRYTDNIGFNKNKALRILTK